MPKVDSLSSCVQDLYKLLPNGQKFRCRQLIDPSTIGCSIQFATKPDKATRIQQRFEHVSNCFMQRDMFLSCSLDSNRPQTGDISLSGMCIVDDKNICIIEIGIRVE